MRVSELANELGKTSKEILEIIKTKDKAAVLYAASNVTKAVSYTHLTLPTNSRV